MKAVTPANSQHRENPRVPFVTHRGHQLGRTFPSFSGNMISLHLEAMLSASKIVAAINQAGTILAGLGVDDLRCLPAEQFAELIAGVHDDAKPWCEFRRQLQLAAAQLQESTTALTLQGSHRLRFDGRIVCRVIGRSAEQVVEFCLGKMHTLKRIDRDLENDALELLHRPPPAELPAQAHQQIKGPVKVELIERKQPTRHKASRQPPRPVGWFTLPRCLTEPIQHVVLFVAGMFTKGRITFEHEESAETRAPSSTELSSPPQATDQGLNAQVVTGACNRWWDGEDFTELSLDVLQSSGVRKPDDPYLMLFLALNFFEHRCYREAAECFVDSFRHPRTADLNERQHMKRELRARYNRDLADLLTREDRAEAIGVIAKLLKWRYEMRQRILDRLEEQPEPAAQQPTLPALACSAAISYLLKRFPRETAGIAAELPALHLVLFYADGLCVREFGHCLFNTRPTAEESGMLYELRDDTANEGSVVGLDQAKLLDAALEAVGILTENDTASALRRESMWLASEIGEKLSSARMESFFSRSAGSSKSANFKRACNILDAQAH